MIRLLFVLTAILWVCVSACGWAQELTTDAERDWKAVRNSDDVRTKVMAERWYNAVRQQDWSDASGKFKVSAKYVEHDPDLKWVKLRTIRGTGKERQVKDVEIPLNKLSKSCQARVRTISVLTEKIAEAKDAEAKKEAEGKADGGSEGGRGEIQDESFEEEAMPGQPRDGRGALDRGLAEMNPREVMERRNRRRGRERAVDDSPPGANAGPPLPAVLPPLPSHSEQVEAAVANERPASADTEAARPSAGAATEFQHPTSAEELKAVFAKAFTAGDKETLEKLFYWDGVPTERRQQTFTSLIDYAGARLLACDLHELADSGSMPGFTIESATYLNIEYETETAGHEMRWPYGEVEGKYYLGAWNPAERH